MLVWSRACQGHGGALDIDSLRGCVALAALVDNEHSKPIQECSCLFVHTPVAKDSAITTVLERSDIAYTALLLQSHTAACCIAYAAYLQALEYLLTFSRAPAPNVPPSTSTLTGFQMHDTIASGNTVTNVFDLILTSIYDKSKTARLRGWSMASFNEVSQITNQVILYPL